MHNNDNDNVFYNLRNYINILRNSINSGKYGDINKQQELLEEIEVFESALNKMNDTTTNRNNHGL